MRKVFYINLMLLLTVPVFAQNPGNLAGHEQSTVTNGASKTMDGETTITTDNRMASSSDLSVQEQLKIAGFPEYIDSGNPEVDRANYMSKKLEWIDNNQELYNRITSSGDQQQGIRRTIERK